MIIECILVMLIKKEAMIIFKNSNLDDKGVL